MGSFCIAAFLDIRADRTFFLRLSAPNGPYNEFFEKEGVTALNINQPYKIDIFVEGTMATLNIEGEEEIFFTFPLKEMSEELNIYSTYFIYGMPAPVTLKNFVYVKYCSQVNP